MLNNFWPINVTPTSYVRTRQRTICGSKLGKECVKTKNNMWFKTRKGVCQGYILSPCLFNLYAEYIMQDARLDDSQAGIKIDRKNINNLRYADNTTVLAESEEELKSLLMKVERGE